MKKEFSKVSNSTNFKLSSHIIPIDKSKGRNNPEKRVTTNSLEKTHLGKLLKTSINEKLSMISVNDIKTTHNSSFNNNCKKAELKIEAKKTPIPKETNSEFNFSKEKQTIHQQFQLQSKVIPKELKKPAEKLVLNMSNAFQNQYKGNFNTNYYTNKAAPSESTKVIKPILNDNKTLHKRQESKISDGHHNGSFHNNYNSEKLTKHSQAVVNKTISNPSNLKQNSFSFNQNLVQKIKQPFQTLANDSVLLKTSTIEEQRSEIMSQNESLKQITIHQHFQTEPSNFASINAHKEATPLKLLEDKFKRMYLTKKLDDPGSFVDKLSIVKCVLEEFLKINDHAPSQPFLSLLLSAVTESYNLGNKYIIEATKKLRGIHHSKTVNYDSPSKSKLASKDKSSRRSEGSFDISNEHNKIITNLNRSNIDDLEAIYFFDKVHMRSNSEKPSKVPKLNINLAIVNADLKRKSIIRYKKTKKKIPKFLPQNRR